MAQEGFQVSRQSEIPLKIELKKVADKCKQTKVHCKKLIYDFLHAEHDHRLNDCELAKLWIFQV